MKLVTTLIALAACKDAATSSGKLELVEVAQSGAIPSLVVSELAKARAAHQRLVVYVGAEWCEPCQRFHRAAAAGELDAELGDLRLLVFDLDRDGPLLEAAGYHSRLVPLFAIPRADGTASERSIEGSIHGAGSPGEITPRLRLLVDQTAPSS